MYWDKGAIMPRPYLTDEERVEDINKVLDYLRQYVDQETDIARISLSKHEARIRRIVTFDVQTILKILKYLKLIECLASRNRLPTWRIDVSGRYVSLEDLRNYYEKPVVNPKLESSKLLAETGAEIKSLRERMAALEAENVQLRAELQTARESAAQELLAELIIFLEGIQNDSQT